MNILSAIHSQLSQGLDVPVGLAVPAKRPARFVTYTYSGGHRINSSTEHVGIELYIWAETLAQTFELAHRVQGLMFNLVSIPGVVHVEEISFREDLDALGDNKPRWYANYTVIISNVLQNKLERK